MMEVDISLAYWLSIIYLNLVAFLAFWYDKWLSKNNRWRIPEKFLLVCCFNEPLVSAIARSFFRHKTKKYYFGILIVLGVLYFGTISEFDRYLNSNTDSNWYRYLFRFWYRHWIVKLLNFVLIIIGIRNTVQMWSEINRTRGRTNHPSGKLF